MSKKDRTITLPKRVMCGAYTIRIFTSPAPMGDDDQDDAYGAFAHGFGEGEIEIAEALTGEGPGEALLHEFCECVVRMNQLELEHRQLAPLAMGLYQMLRTSGWLPRIELPPVVEQDDD